MSDIFKKTYTVAEPGCGLTVLSMEGSEINLFGSHTVIKTSAEDVFEPIKDFLHEKLVEEKADTMYYIGVTYTAIFAVLGGVAIIGGGVGAFATAGATLPIAGLGVVLAGAAVSLGDYTFNTLGPDRESGSDRSWLQFYWEANNAVGRGMVKGTFATVVAGVAILLCIYGGEAIAALPGLIPSIVGAGASGATVGGAVEAAGLAEAVLGFGSVAELVAFVLQSGKGGESKEGVYIEKGSKKEVKQHLSSQQANKMKKEVLEGKDVKFRTREEALDFIKKKFPNFKQETAGNRSSEGWHFDSHPINGSSDNIDHINIYSKKLKFRVHITWGD